MTAYVPKLSTPEALCLPQQLRSGPTMILPTDLILEGSFLVGENLSRGRSEFEKLVTHRKLFASLAGCLAARLRNTHYFLISPFPGCLKLATHVT
eukprot:7986760-Karenia_brevis.AAC.1